MKLCMLIMTLVLSTHAFGARLKLPRGGSVLLDEKNWESHLINLKGEKVMTLIHKKHKDLQGFVLGGQIREEGPCGKTVKNKKWVYCRKSSVEGKISNEQVFAQKKIGKSYQNYLFSFNLPAGKEKEYQAQIEAFKKTLESSP